QQPWCRGAASHRRNPERSHPRLLWPGCQTPRRRGRPRVLESRVMGLHVAIRPAIILRGDARPGRRLPALGIGCPRPILHPTPGAPPMAALAADRNLLFGLLALQNGLINQVRLVAAFQAWTLDKGRALADHLVGRGDLDADDRSAVEALVSRHLKKHGGDAEKSLAAIPARPPPP